MNRTFPRSVLRPWIGAPGIALTLILILALGFAVSTTLFALVRGLLLKPLPYGEPDRLVLIWNRMGSSQAAPAVSPLDFLDYLDHRRPDGAFSDFAAATGGEIGGLSGILTGPRGTRSANVALVSANFFELLQVAPEFGRSFTPQEDVPNGRRVVVVSHRLWQERFEADPDLLGRNLLIDDVAHEVVGILPDSFRLHLPHEAVFLRDSDLWTPLRFDFSRPVPRNVAFLTVFARLKESATLQRAQDEMDRLANTLREAHAEHRSANLGIRVVPLLDDVVKQFRPGLWALFGAGLLVLLIASANAAGLLVTRAAGRRHESSLRAALGATGRRLAWESLVETMAISAIAWGLGCGAAWGVLRLLRNIEALSWPRLDQVQMDSFVILAVLSGAVIVALAIGAAPALVALRVQPSSALTRAPRHSARSPQGLRFRRTLIAGEVALSIILLASAGWVWLKAHALADVEQGYRPSGATIFRIALPQTHYPSGRQQRNFFLRLMELLKRLPGTDAVGAISQMPLTGSGPLQGYAYDQETASQWESAQADLRIVSDDFFRAAGTRLKAGRFFDSSDAAGAPQSVIVDLKMVRRAWPEEDPIGRLLQLSPGESEGHLGRVVGVVEHMRNHDMAREVREQIYLPLSRETESAMTIVLRSRDTKASARMVRETVTRLDPGLPILDLQPWTAHVARQQAASRAGVVLISVFAATAWLLTMVGIQGLVAHDADRQARQFGIRRALGESRWGVLKRSLVGALFPVLAGILLGIPLAWASGRILQQRLFQVDAMDWYVPAVASLALIASALSAAMIPASRASLKRPARLLTDP